MFCVEGTKSTGGRKHTAPFVFFYQIDVKAEKSKEEDTNQKVGGTLLFLVI